MASLGLSSRFLRGAATARIVGTGRLFSSQIELEFVSATPGSDGQIQVEKATGESGEKKLRNIMLDNNIDLYASFIVEGMDLLSEKTKSEFRNLKKKPDSWRLACQTTVGNKENSGKFVVQKMPQMKK